MDIFVVYFFFVCFFYSCDEYDRIKIDKNTQNVRQIE